MKHRCQVRNLEMCVNLGKPESTGLREAGSPCESAGASSGLRLSTPARRSGREASLLTGSANSYLPPNICLSVEPLGGFGNGFMGKNRTPLFSIFLY